MHCQNFLPWGGQFNIVFYIELNIAEWLLAVGKNLATLVIIEWSLKYINTDFIRTFLHLHQCPPFATRLLYYLYSIQDDRRSQRITDADTPLKQDEPEYIATLRLDGTIHWLVQCVSRPFQPCSKHSVTLMYLVNQAPHFFLLIFFLATPALASIIFAKSVRYITSC